MRVRGSQGGAVAAGVLVLALLVPILVVAIIGDDPAPAAPSALALSDIPVTMLTLYQQGAALCPGLDWTVLAGIGKIESDHGRSTAPGVHSGANYAGAEGPMQFEPGTWAVYGDGVTMDVYDPAAAVPAAARLLCADGAPGNIPGALFAYNHDWGYVLTVLTQAEAYAAAAAPGVTGTVTPGTTPEELLADPNVILPPAARSDVATGLIDQRVIDFLHWAGEHHTIVISVLKTGHTVYVEGTDRISNHFFGRAADIAVIDGVPVTANDPAARSFALEAAGLTAGRPSEIGSSFPELQGLPGFFLETPDHVHVGWGP